MKLKTMVVIFATAFIATSCAKTDTNLDSDFLKPDKYFIYMRKELGARGSVFVESKIAWHLIAPTTAPDWMIIDRLTGENKDSVMVTITKENISAGTKSAEFIVSPDSGITVKKIKLTVLQYDSTCKGK
jgi:hypothetical protein